MHPLPCRSLPRASIKLRRSLLVMVACSTGWLPVMAQAAPTNSAPDPLAYGTEQPNGLAPLAPTPGKNGMAVSAQKLASDIGADILAKGGNAADTAVAMGYALAVVYPAAGNIGGGGFMMLRQPGKPSIFLDFRE